MKQSVCWWCYDHTDLTPAALTQHIISAGYNAVEIVEPEHWELVTQHGLAIAAHKAHFSIEQGLNRAEYFPQIEREFQENLELAVKWNIPNLICFSGNREGLSDTEGAKTTAEHLSQLAPHAEAAGVTLILELLNSKIDHPDYQCDRTEWGVEVVKQVGSDSVKLLYDIYHMQIMEGDIIHMIEQYHPYIGHYHTAGVPGRNEINDTQELNYPAIVRAISKTGYTGYIGQEFAPKGDPVSALKDAYRRCDVSTAS